MSWKRSGRRVQGIVCGTARSPLAALLAATLAVLALAAPRPAAAARYRIDTRTGALAYPVVGRDGLVVLDERVIQSRVLLMIDDILADDPDVDDPALQPDVAMGLNLRWFANPGVASAATDPSNMLFVPNAQDMGLEVLWAWVEATDLLGGWLNARLGRIVHEGPLGWRSDDGARVRFDPFPWLGLSVVGGFENVRGLRLSNSPFAPEGVDRWSQEGEGADRYRLHAPVEHRPTVGAMLDGTAGPVQWAAAYRRTWRSVEGGISEELLGAELSADLEFLSAFGSTRVDLVTGLVADASAELSAKFDRGRHRLEARYEYFRPTFDAESVFWVFAADPFHEVTLRYRFPLAGALRGEAWASARHIEDPGGDVAIESLAGPFTDLGGGLGLSLATPDFSASLRWKAIVGSTTSLAGADLTVDVPLGDRWSLFAIGSGWYYEDLLRDASYGVGGAGRAGAAVTIYEGIRLEAEAQVAHDTREGTTFAVFTWLDLGVAL
ncbi:MAG: hypothetical protein HY905_23620 [Deltaproteobacteria bacterium]|nr:hypothetical protein [Deltaproteobacteria bacterium]